MPSCIVKGCTHYTGMKASNPLLTMHVFPRELSRIKLWLQQIGQIGDIDAFAAKVFDASRTGKYRICSAHFAPGSYASQGSRVVLKHDAIPTLFPGIHPRPPPDLKPQLVQAKKLEPAANKMDSPAPKATTQRKEVVPPANVDCQKRLQEGARRNQGAKQGRTQGPPQETLLDVNGRYTVGLSKESRHKDMKNKPDVLRYNSSPRGDATDENRRALWSLENVMVALLQHLGDAPLSSRAQKQKTGRLMNQTAEIVSLLTGEEWTVVKKNSHISKFYNMIREVPIKCGDVAVFFSMDEWDYIEDHEDQYKHVMVEEPKSPQFNGSSDGMKTGFFPKTQCEQRPNFNDIDFGNLFQNSVSSPNTEKYEETIKDLQILEMSCSSDDDMDPPSSDRVDSPTGHKDIGDEQEELDEPQSPESPPPPTGHKDIGDEQEELDEPQSPESPPPPTDLDKRKEIRKDDKEEIPDKPKPGKTLDVQPEAVTDSPASNPTKQPPPDNVTADPTPDTPPAPDTPPKKESPQAADAIEESQESSSSELWIAQDGTTSSTWIPQDDPRPKGRNCSRYGKNGPRIQCPVSLSGTTTIICMPELPLKRPESALEPRCDLCDLTFPDQLELELHQLTHSKRQRL